MTNETQVRTLDAGALKALAHPLRVKIFDLLASRGPQTASSLAALVGETSGSTSYHLRALAAHDLIREVEGRGTARERWWERPKGRIDMPGPDEQMSPANRAAAQIVTSEFFRLRHETLMQYLNRPESDVPEGWRDVGITITTHLDVTPAQAMALRQEIEDLIEQAIERYRGQTGPDVRRVSVRAELFDLPTSPREALAGAGETTEAS
ncbi:helix-turn-helix domain-containing protein [Microbacterium paraoxydans]|jgi:DNA-binding transcriptional ArsR family regulator|uniref:ArsR/SmtB family transcription factor n=1 Tax=Microbacterium TaxID=33882 RepID=UPI000D01711D|nr:helix-turn-helix domain-containing protein [Microbacterium sp. str. 'China']AVL97431.1 transcriptional regulator [Microbacterium sp. str. 'China']